MAEIVLGMATSHGPMLSTPPEQWGARVVADKANPAHYYQGRRHTFDELVALRAGEGLDKEITPEKWRLRHAACREALRQMAAVFDRVKPDVAVILGNDQMELFTEVNIPAFAVFCGDTILNREYDAAKMAKLPPGIPVSVPGHIPPHGAEYPAQADLARHIISSVIGEGFDVSALRGFPAEHSTIPHAYGFVYRQIMSDRVIPSVPIFTNTFYPPNQPELGRCYAFGKAILRAVQSWPAKARVALIASGGLSHFVIDEEIDRAVLAALRAGEIEELAGFGESIYQSGTSEIKNWIPVAGAMAELGLPMSLVDYVPCYRSEAGTGNGMGFVYWEKQAA